ncbi:hypothetical protein ACIXJQ_01785 [Bacteroides fragilis]
MMFLMYLRHQPGYVACYTRSSLEHLAQCSRGTVELFSNVLLNFGGGAGACKRCGQRSVPRPEQGTELLCGSACNSLWDRKKNSEKPIRQYKTRKDKIKQKQ